MGIQIEFNVRISDKLAREINDEKSTLGIKRFEYSSDSGIIEFNDNVTQAQATTRLQSLGNRLVRQIT